MKDIFKNFDSLKFREGVYIHNKVDNNNIYDKIWDLQGQNMLDGKDWGDNRHAKLWRFTRNYIDFKDKVVLDAASGLGRFSVTMAEVGAKLVYAVDGSYTGPKKTYDLIKNKKIPYKDIEKQTPDWQPPTEHALSKAFFEFTADVINLNNLEKALDKFCFIQANLNNITELFKPKQFDVIIHHMALHHMEYPGRTIEQLSQLLKEDGMLIFNFFTPEDLDEIVYIIRDIFINEKFEYVYKFLGLLGRLHGQEPITLDQAHKNISDYFKENQMPDESMLRMADKFKKLLEQAVSPETVFKYFHLEDATTPYLWVIPPKKMVQFIHNNLPGYKTCILDSTIKTLNDVNKKQSCPIFILTKGALPPHVIKLT